MSAMPATVRDVAARQGLLRHDLSRRVVLKFTPRLHFKLDVAAERGDRVLNLLSELDVPADEPPTPDEK